MNGIFTANLTLKKMRTMVKTRMVLFHIRTVVVQIILYSPHIVHSSATFLTMWSKVKQAIT